MRTRLIHGALSTEKVDTTTLLTPLVCPECEMDNIHVRSVKTRTADNMKYNSDQLVRIDCCGECGAKFAIFLEFHEGRTFICVKVKQSCNEI